MGEVLIYNRISKLPLLFTGRKLRLLGIGLEIETTGDCYIINFLETVSVIFLESG